MDKKVCRILEFDKIIDKLKELTLSSMGREIAEHLMPVDDFSMIQEWQEETLEAEALLHFTGSTPMDTFEDIRRSLRKAEIGSVLTAKELLETAHCLKISRSVKSSVPEDKEKYKRIGILASHLITRKDLEDEIYRCIISEDEISDYASRELSNIRRQIRNTNERIREKLNSIIHSSQNMKYLQDAIITIRNDRYVVPVRQEYRSSIPGLIHDQSSSGATLYIEPMAVVELNNDLKQWAAKEKAEIEKILSELTAQVSSIAQELANNLSILARLDFIFAKGRLSHELKAVAPKLNQHGFIKIINGRHPLILKERVVPISIWLGDEFTTLVITGPNTGGKTVTLKTVGLFTLMAQAGLHVPAELGTELAVFEKVFADIGDEQSIEQSLSTFSSHMTNIVSIMENITPNSLVLFDELGAGTDPTEGAALAMAVLDLLLQRRIRTIATTHYSELKAFALTRHGVENASVEFDVETLRPTYRLSIGIPGKSNAFEISKRLGLGEDVIARARDFLSQENIRFEDIISNAEQQRQLAEKERLLAEKVKNETIAMRDQLEKQKQQLEQQRDRILREAKEEARKILLQAREESETIIHELKKLAAEQSQEIQMRAIQEHRARLKSNIDKMEGELHDAIKPVPRLVKPPKDIKPGDEVYVINLGQNGTALGKPDSKGELQVQLGILKINVHISNIRKLEDSNTTSNTRIASRKQFTIQNRNVGLELDIRGQVLDEAIMNLDKYLDDAFLAGLTEVNIIHGKGTGTLRGGIHQHLKYHPHVKSFRLGRFGEGESGVTVVELK